MGWRGISSFTAERRPLLGEQPVKSRFLAAVYWFIYLRSKQAERKISLSQLFLGQPDLQKVPQPVKQD
ncbi:MAG: hypothetical protein JXA42_18495 [Anaerolineales bacterium]|nr:hypothetical protein [Anaerolineales bacterium]